MRSHRFSSVEVVVVVVVVVVVDVVAVGVVVVVVVVVGGVKQRGLIRSCPRLFRRR